MNSIEELLKPGDFGRFWSKVRVGSEDECWPWLARCAHKGYGEFQLRKGGRKRCARAHRVAFVLSGGSIPIASIVRHSCDSPRCVNPRHLLLGTHQENMDDMTGRRRQATAERNGNTRMAESDILLIRLRWEDGCAPSDIAAAFGISRQHVHDIGRRKWWAHFDPDNAALRRLREAMEGKA